MKALIVRTHRLNRLKIPTICVGGTIPRKAFSVFLYAAGISCGATSCCISYTTPLPATSSCVWCGADFSNTAIDSSSSLTGSDSASLLCWVPSELPSEGSLAAFEMRLRLLSHMQLLTELRSTASPPITPPKMAPTLELWDLGLNNFARDELSNPLGGCCIRFPFRLLQVSPC